MPEIPFDQVQVSVAINITKSDQLAQMLIENLKFVTMAATIIGLITLMGAVIGLMNIMLVSVTERTQEIGMLRAVGMTRGQVVRMVLAEAGLVVEDTPQGPRWELG